MRVYCDSEEAARTGFLRLTGGIPLIYPGRLIQSRDNWHGSWFRSLTRGRGLRLFVVGGAGWTIEGDPQFIDRFALGGPTRMTAFGIGEQRTDHYAYGGLGVFQRAFRLPDFMGRSVFVGAWAESGTAWDHDRDGQLTAHGSAAIVADTLIGPLFAGASAGIRGESRFFIGIGRIFR